jgi:hypothetical protein
MSEESKRQAPAETPKRGDAAWKAAKQAIANRNEQASKVAREKRQARDDKHAAALRAADKRERAQLAKRKP